MKRILMMIAALSLVAACGQNAKPKAESETANGGLAVAPLKFKERVLANGLRVYALPDENTANVSVQVWYNVGSKDDPVGRSGFAHLFEHIMFKATRNMPPEFFDRLTEDVGGFNNASTADDFTNYYEVVTANHLERILWAEADRMGSLVVDEATFDSERDVVKEELRQSILAAPYGRLFGLYISQANYSVHPYGRPGIGSIEDLDAATIDDVRAFHATYYRPDNAVLVVAGNFKEKDLDRWVDAYFGPVATPKRAIPRVAAVEPARTTPKDLTAYAPNVPLPAILVSYPQFAAKDPNLAALRVLDAILSRGESSRLYQALVYEQQVAAEVFTNLDPTQDPGAYSFGVILSEGKTIDEGLASLSAEIARLRDGPPSAAELDEAKNEIVTETLEGRETAFGRAFELADSVIRYDDPAYADALLAAVQKVTASDVQRVAQDLFNESARVVVR
ncbi:MAG: pitrilysin family protein, partial [Parvularculaceae bacterium]